MAHGLNILCIHIGIAAGHIKVTAAHTEVSHHLCACNKMPEIERNNHHCDAEHKGDGQYRIALETRQKVVYGHKHHWRHFLSAVQDTPPNRFKAFSCAALTDSVNGRDSGNPPQTEQTEQKGCADDQRSPERCHDYARTILRYDQRFRDAPGHIAGKRNTEQKTGQPRRGRQNNVFRKVQPPDLTVFKAKGLHDADFAIIVLHRRDNGET